MAPSVWSDQLQNHRMWSKEDCLSSAMTTGQLFLELWWPPTDPSPLHRRPQNHSLPSRHVRIIIERYFCQNPLFQKEKRIQCGQN
jgi:hypothetical protein